MKVKREMIDVDSAKWESGWCPSTDMRLYIKICVESEMHQQPVPSISLAEPSEALTSDELFNEEFEYDGVMIISPRRRVMFVGWLEIRLNISC